jgi:hypothetical protein
MKKNKLFFITTIKNGKNRYQIRNINDGQKLFNRIVAVQVSDTTMMNKVQMPGT